MKFGTILGSLTLAAFEVSRANSQSVQNPTDLSARTGLEARDNQFCCVLAYFNGQTTHRLVPYLGISAVVAQNGDCKLMAFQFLAQSPANDGCKDWVLDLVDCDDNEVPLFAYTQPLYNCH
ncbi:hypothetical protein E4U43_002798 [Claviceps pusilla]|uniref:Uncharacterized protein n=1 Tax=Claviceps pusilla TaxID=123648 RepID=A0A9P7N873_9HYPO|nr:hypothetical protein E4U43_002798 [Claviceps pusilla]